MILRFFSQLNSYHTYSQKKLARKNLNQTCPLCLFNHTSVTCSLSISNYYKMIWLGICENFSPPKFKRSIFVTKTVDPLSICDLLDADCLIQKTSLRVQLHNFCEVEMLPTGCRTTGLYPDSRPKGSTSSGYGVLGTSRWSRPSDSWSDGERRSLPRAVSARCSAGRPPDLWSWIWSRSDTRACLGLVQVQGQVVVSPPPLPPLAAPRVTRRFSSIPPRPHSPSSRVAMKEAQAWARGPRWTPPHARVAGRGERGAEPRTMALGVLFHGAQLALDLAVAGMSLAVALGFFALITTLLCSAAFLHHSKPAA